MKNCVPSCTCLQYADDSIIYQHRKAKDIRDIRSCTNILTSELSNLLTWSSSNNLAFNAGKMRAMLFTTSQMEKLYGFEQDVFTLENEQIKWHMNGKQHLDQHQSPLNPGEHS